MVLKKSVCRFNSGATQRRVTHKGLYRTFQYQTCRPLEFNTQNCIRLSADLKIHNEETINSMSLFLEDLHDYLDLDIKNMPSITPQQRIRQQPTSFRQSECTLNKNKMWLLPEQIRTMMTDIDFLQNINPRICFSVKNVCETLKSKRCNVCKTKIITASEVIAKSTENTKHEQDVSVSRKRNTYHGRGVQRPHLFNEKQKKITEQQVKVKQTEEQVGCVDLYLYEPLHIDARSVCLDYMGKKFGGWGSAARGKSSTKLKGRNKNRKPCRKCYCSLDLNYDKMIGIEEVYDNCSETFFDQEEKLKTPGSTCRSLSYDMTDLIKNSNSRIKRKKVRRKKHVATERNVSQPSDGIKYSKGSFIVIPREESPFGGVSCLGIKVNSKKTDSSSLEQNEVNNLLNDAFDEKPNTSEANSIGRIHYFDKNFVQVSLTIMEELKTCLYSSNETTSTEQQIERQNTDSKEQQKDMQNTLFKGESVPDCFLVNFSQNKASLSSPGWKILTGKKTGPDSQWWVSIQEEHQTFEQSKEQLEQLLPDSHNSSIRLSDLVERVKVTCKNKPIDLQQTFSNRINNEKLLPPNSYIFLPPNADQKVDICSDEEAFQMLQKKDNSCKQKSDLAQSSNVIIQTQPSTECSVCLINYDVAHLATSSMALLPCRHGFCISCWRIHLLQQIDNGANSITCMETNCCNVMNTITASSIVPFNIIVKWQRQVRSRFLDSHQDCSWCPNVLCKKVAVSRQGPMKLQFGKPILCDCRHFWCGSCFADPHWPASCEQMAVYKKLLAKTGKEFYTKDACVNFQVEVKKCPNCLYPIEKNMGCFGMHCIMCGHYFCWNCMGSISDHEECKKQVQTTSYILSNKLELTLPLKHFLDCSILRKKTVRINKLQQWFNHLCFKTIICRKSSNHQSSSEIIEAIKAAEESLHFVKQVVPFQETMYILIDFANLNHSKKSRAFQQALAEINRLNFIISRLEDKILEKSLSDVCKYYKNVKCLVEAGQIIVTKLVLLVPVLQNMSKNIPTAWIGELDPELNVRFK